MTKRTQRRIVIRGPAGSNAAAAFRAVAPPVSPTSPAMTAPCLGTARRLVDIGRVQAFDLIRDRQCGLIPALAGVQP